MSSTYEIPLSPEPQTFAIDLAGTTYRLRLVYADVDQGGWVLDISDVSGNSIVAGIPLVTGHDLLEQYAYLGFGGQLFVATDGDPDLVPTFANLGVTSHLYFVTT